MREVEKWRWRIQWAGRWGNTRAHFTEDEIRARHPEAVRIQGSRILVQLPQTQAERDAALQPRGRR